jgi:Mrp family chromosome partitioning ATPase
LIIAAVLALCLIAGAVFTSTADRLFTATAHILFTPPRDRTIGSEGSLLQSPLDVSALESQVSLILSSMLLQQVVESEGLARDPEFVGKSPPSIMTSILSGLRSLFEAPTIEAQSPESDGDLAMMSLRQRLGVSRVANSYGVVISMTSRDPAKAARLANAVANSYISDRLSTRLGDTQRSVRLINPATVPASPSHPRLLPILISALCGGLFLGFAVAFSAEAFTVGFVTPQQVESVLGIPVLAMLAKLTAKDCQPFGDKIDAPGLLIVKPFARFSEAIRSLRNMLQIATHDRAAKIVQVTSTMPDEGKTTVAMCLAISAAASGQNVVVVDCDLRHTKLTSHFQLGSSTGLVDLLEGSATLEETIRLDPKYGVRVLPMKDVLTRLAGQFDFVVIDTPPLDPVVDALMLASSVDNVLVVVRWNYTPQSVVKRALKMVWGENEKVGAVLNFIDSRRAVAYDRDAYTRFDSKRYRSYYQE